MKLTVLVDNHTYVDRYYLGEPALSILFETADRTVLLDCGYSDAFMINAERMGIDLSRVTDIALSHGHNDHTGGLPAFLDRFKQPIRLYAHPDVFIPRRDDDGRSLGSPLNLQDLPARAQLFLTKEPVPIGRELLFLGGIPADHRRCIGERLVGGCWCADSIPDDTALVALSGPLPSVITGCSHSGIGNIVDYAASVTGSEKLHTVLGGFHLFKTDERFLHAAEAFRRHGLTEIYPSHCTSLAVKAGFIAEGFRVHEVGVGMTLTL